LAVQKKAIKSWSEVPKRMGDNVSQEGGVSLGPTKPECAFDYSPCLFIDARDSDAGGGGGGGKSSYLVSP
jgi:hypothetical protein